MQRRGRGLGFDRLKIIRGNNRERNYNGIHQVPPEYAEDKEMNVRIGNRTICIPSRSSWPLKRFKGVNNGPTFMRPADGPPHGDCLSLGRSLKDGATGRL